MGQSDLTKRQLRLTSASRILQMKSKMAQSELGQALKEEAQLKERIEQCVAYLARSDDLALAMQPVIASEYTSLLAELVSTSERVTLLRSSSTQHKRRSEKVNEKLDEAKAFLLRRYEERQGHETVIEHHMRRKPRTR